MRQGQPNIILIVADDLGYGDLASYGHPACDTPCTDALAANGMKLTDFHANGAVCSPTRAAMLTGRYQQRCGIVHALGENEPGLSTDHTTIARILADRGYATGLFGKWHLGMEDHEAPNAHGFDTFRGHRHGAVDYFSHVNKFGCIDWWHNETPAQDDGYCTEIIARDSVQFIEDHAHEPFFLYMAHSAIHFPWMAPDDTAHRQPGVRYDDLSKLGPHAPDEVGRVVRQMIASLDETVGQVTDTLAKLGLTENTLIVFTSDNGGIATYAEQFTDISSNAPLRGQKASLYEGGHRVPTIVSWPGHVAPGVVHDETTMTMDLLPTFAALAGVPAEAHRFDGVDLTALFTQQTPLTPRDLFWQHGEQCAVRRGPWKLYVDGDCAELYNLTDDISETRDVAADEPRLVGELKQALADWQHDVTPHRAGG